MAARKFTELGLGPANGDPPQRNSGVCATPPELQGFTEQEVTSNTRGVRCPAPTQKEDLADDARQLAVRDTIPALKPLGDDNPTASQRRRRFTLEGGWYGSGGNASSSRSGSPSGNISTPPLSTSPASSESPRAAPRASASALQRGRYSSQHDDDENQIAVVLTPATPIRAVVAPSPAPKNTLRRSRQPVRVDDVGVTRIVATKEGSNATADAWKPRIADRKLIAEAQLTAREAFVLSLVDGKLSVSDLVDATGMPEREVTIALTRLTRFGIVSR